MVIRHSSFHSLAVHASLVTLFVDNDPLDQLDCVVFPFPLLIDVVNTKQNLRCPATFLTGEVDPNVTINRLGALNVKAGVWQLGEAGGGLGEVVLGHEAVGGRYQPRWAHQGRGALDAGGRLEVEHCHEGEP